VVLVLVCHFAPRQIFGRVLNGHGHAIDARPFVYGVLFLLYTSCKGRFLDILSVVNFLSLRSFLKGIDHGLALLGLLGDHRQLISFLLAFG